MIDQVATRQLQCLSTCVRLYQPSSPQIATMMHAVSVDKIIKELQLEDPSAVKAIRDHNFISEKQHTLLQ